MQIGVHKSGGAKLYTRVSEMLQWILSSKDLGQHPAQMLRLHITELRLPDKASVTVYAGHRCFVFCLHNLSISACVQSARVCVCAQRVGEREADDEDV